MKGYNGKGVIFLSICLNDFGRQFNMPQFCIYLLVAEMNAKWDEGDYVENWILYLWTTLMLHNPIKASNCHLPRFDPTSPVG